MSEVPGLRMLRDEESSSVTLAADKSEVKRFAVTYCQYSIYMVEKEAWSQDLTGSESHWRDLLL